MKHDRVDGVKRLHEKSQTQAKAQNNGLTVWIITH